VHAHRGYQASVVNLHTRDTVRHQKLPPFFVNREAIGEQTEFFLEKLCEPVCLLRREAVTITIYGASTGIPKFADILGGITEHAIMSKNGILAETMEDNLYGRVSPSGEGRCYRRGTASLPSSRSS
jgi:hypothetical protein